MFTFFPGVYFSTCLFIFPICMCVRQPVELKVETADLNPLLPFSPCLQYFHICIFHLYNAAGRVMGKIKPIMFLFGNGHVFHAYIDLTLQMARLKALGQFLPYICLFTFIPVATKWHVRRLSGIGNFRSHLCGAPLKAATNGIMPRAAPLTCPRFDVHRLVTCPAGTYICPIRCAARPQRKVA